MYRSETGGFLFSPNMTHNNISLIVNSHDVNHFILFLENHDGITYNSLMHGLSSLYSEIMPQNTAQECKFISQAVAMSSTFVNYWFDTFMKTYPTDRIFFCRNKAEIISYAASEMALAAFQEFQIGNLY
jgi:hypothetical protein